VLPLLVVGEYIDAEGIAFMRRSGIAVVQFMEACVEMSLINWDLYLQKYSFYNCIKRRENRG
jgi:hypothetical protein